MSGAGLCCWRPFFTYRVYDANNRVEFILHRPTNSWGFTDDREQYRARSFHIFPADSDDMVISNSVGTFIVENFVPRTFFNVIQKQTVNIEFPAGASADSKLRLIGAWFLF